MKLGNVGDSNTLVWLYCEICKYGKISIKQGWRKGLPQDKKPIWVLCPLLRGHFPRDRRLIEDCKHCKHYKGISHSVYRISKQQEITKQVHHVQKAKQKYRQRKYIMLEVLEEAIKEKERQDKKWLEEEKNNVV